MTSLSDPSNVADVVLAFWDCGHVEVDRGKGHECDGRDVCSATYRRAGVLEQLRPANISRVCRWHSGAEVWTGADWSNAMCGESGEAANVVKKLRRHETGAGTGYNTPDVETLLAALAEELADVVTYADLLAHHYGVDLPAAIVAKFNRVSEAQGFPERIG